MVDSLRTYREFKQELTLFLWYPLTEICTEYLNAERSLDQDG